MGIYSSKIKRISYKDLQDSIKRDSVYIINTLSLDEQHCLIKHTIHATDEENMMNDLLTSKKDTPIIVYGKHSCDESIYVKYDKLTKLGFQNISLYVGGLFEWLCLQDIYSDVFFPTSCKCLEILDYAPRKFNL
jgi:3-mercaptopyruvate sulfurtransferase SseA